MAAFLAAYGVEGFESDGAGVVEKSSVLSVMDGEVGEANRVVLQVEGWGPGTWIPGAEEEILITSDECAETSTHEALGRGCLGPVVDEATAVLVGGAEPAWAWMCRVVAILGHGI